ncbi:hypothetical protein [Natrinema salinisoli]|nr:hypothetical protein [Natrinema salinisoli]
MVPRTTSVIDDCGGGDASERIADVLEPEHERVDREANDSNPSFPK